MERLVEQFLKIPLQTRIGILGLLAAAITAGTYFFVITDVEDQVAKHEASLTRLRKDLVEKQVIANNLNQYRREKELLEQKLQEALSILPEKPEIDELLRQLNDVGKKASLEITKIEPGPEAPEAFYARIPIKMSVVGNFHEIALFFESVSRLRRIVNITGIQFSDPIRRNEKVVVRAEFLATTFRFIAPGSAQAGGAKP